MDAVKRALSLNGLILFFSLILVGWLLWYFYTGLGGAQELVSRLISIAIILQVLFMYRDAYFYPWLPPRVNDLIVALYIGIALYAFYYFWLHFEDVLIYRQGSSTRGGSQG